MACDIEDREGESPSPMELRLGRMFHGSATGRRRDHTLPEALGHVKRFTRQMTVREAPAAANG